MVVPDKGDKISYVLEGQSRRVINIFYLHFVKSVKRNDVFHPILKYLFMHVGFLMH